MHAGGTVAAARGLGGLGGSASMPDLSSLHLVSPSTHATTSPSPTVGNRQPAARSRRTAGREARLLRRKALPMRSSAATTGEPPATAAATAAPAVRSLASLLDARAPSQHGAAPVPIHAIRLQPLGLSGAVERQPVTPQRLPVVAQPAGVGSVALCEEQRLRRSLGLSKDDGEDELDESCAAEAAVPKAELEVYQKLWARDRKAFWARAGADLPAELMLTLRQTTELCAKAAAKRGGSCDLNLCNRRLGDEGAQVLGLVLSMGHVYAVPSMCFAAAHFILASSLLLPSALTDFSRFWFCSV